MTSTTATGLTRADAEQPRAYSAPGLTLREALRIFRGCTNARIVAAMLLAYEWAHFLIHSSYSPRSWYYRYIWRAHRLHHYRNERYWYGVTIHLADHILRTFPQRDAVETSPTARTLGVDAA